MNRQRRSRLAGVLLIAAAVWCATAGHVSAQVAAPAPLDTPLPAKWRAPVERFLTELRVANVTEVLTTIKADVAGSVLNDTILLRLEHPQFCEQDRCLTVIGEIRAEEFRPHALFLAGKLVTRADALGTHPGIATGAEISFLRDSRNPSEGDVVAIEALKGWIVVPRLKP